MDVFKRNSSNKGEKILKINKVTIIGLGAIGGFMASKLSQVLDKTQLRVLAEGERKARLEKEGILINDKHYTFSVVTPKEQEPADLILIATKYNGLDQAIKDIRGHVGKDTVIMSLLNGVNSEEKLQAVYGEQVLYALMRVSSVRTKEGIYFDAKSGYIEFGEAINDRLSERVMAIKTLFEAAGIGVKVPQDMKKALWYKYACNVAENQSSAILGIPFGAWRVSEDANALREAAMREVFAVAKKKGIELGEEEILNQRKLLSKVVYENKTSMLQDIENKRPTEVEMFAGEMIRMGKEVGVPTPINEIFYHAIRVLEEKNKGLI